MDILINNAGLAWGERQETLQKFEMIVGVNHIGHFKLTTDLLKLDCLNKNGRIVNVSSLMYK